MNIRKAILSLCIFSFCFSLSGCGLALPWQQDVAEEKTAVIQPVSTSSIATINDLVSRIESYLGTKGYDGYQLNLDGTTIDIAVWKSLYAQTERYLICRYLREKYDGENDLFWEWIKTLRQNTVDSIQDYVNDSRLTDVDVVLTVYGGEDKSTPLLIYENGQMVYDLFHGYEDEEGYEQYWKTQEKPTVEILSDEQRAAIRTSTATFAPVRGLSGDRTVYVSNRSKTIHSIPDCSGMKSYKTMTKSEADSKGYHYCSNCW